MAVEKGEAGGHCLVLLVCTITKPKILYWFKNHRSKQKYQSGRKSRFSQSGPSKKCSSLLLCGLVDSALACFGLEKEACKIQQNDAIRIFSPLRPSRFELKYCH
jgi:hypothetical protein